MLTTIACQTSFCVGSIVQPHFLGKPVKHILYAVFLSAGVVSTSNAAQVTWASDQTKTSGSELSVTNFSALSEDSRFRLTASNAVLEASRRNVKPFNTAFLPHGGLIAGSFGKLSVGSGDVWLPTLSWAGEAGAIATLDSISGKSFGTNPPTSTITSWSCTSRRTVRVHISGQDPYDSNSISLDWVIDSQTSLTITCWNGELRITLRQIEEP